MIESAMHWLLQVLAVPEVGLTSVFIISFVSATVLPMGSEPAVFAVVKANSALFWPAVAVATAGNTLGGAFDYWLGYRAKRLFAQHSDGRSLRWLAYAGPKAMLLAWLPVVGDPLCAVAGWLKLPVWPCIFYMAIGKCLRYILLTWLLLNVPDGFWARVAGWLA